MFSSAGVARHRRELDLRFGDESQRAFRAAHDGAEVEAAVAVAQMHQVVARHAAIELRESFGDQIRVVLPDAIQHAQDVADAILAAFAALELGRRQRPRMPLGAVHEARRLSSSTWSRVLP